MPKGDRELLKADIDDGYTTLANLLLEALAMAKLSGVQKGICIFICRRTYGWGRKDDQITLKDFAQACCTSEPYISKQLKQLVEWNIIKRTTYEPGKAPRYTINTRVAEWYKGCINVQGLHECTIQGLYKCAIQGLHECARVNQGQAQQSQGVEPYLNKDLNKYKTIDDDNARAREIPSQINFVNTWEQEFAEPIPSMATYKLQSYIDDGMDAEVVCESIRRSRAQGHKKLSYVMGVLNDWLSKQVKTMADVGRVDADFERYKALKNQKTKGREPPKKEDDPYAFLDISKFTYQGN